MPVVGRRSGRRCVTGTEEPAIKGKPSSRLWAYIHWASVHEYDRDDTPYWPLTLTQVGRILRIEDIPRIFTGFLKGHASNSPTRDEMGESQVRPMKVNGTGTHPKNDTADGGERSIELPEDVFT